MYPLSTSKESLFVNFTTPSPWSGDIICERYLTDRNFQFSNSDCRRSHRYFCNFLLLGQCSSNYSLDFDIKLPLHFFLCTIKIASICNIIIRLELELFGQNLCLYRHIQLLGAGGFCCCLLLLLYAGLVLFITNHFKIEKA